MKIYSLKLKNGIKFLERYRDVNKTGGLLLPNRIKPALSERFVLEVRFPPLPNPVLLKACAVELDPRTGGVIALFDKIESAKKDFLIQVATKAEQTPSRRRHRRLSVEFPVVWQVRGVEFRHQGRVEDVSRGGMYVQTEWTPPVGTELKLTLDPGDAEEKPISLNGKVAWVYHGVRNAGMGIRFRERTSTEQDRLLELIRSMYARGEVHAPTVPSGSAPPRSSIHFFPSR